MNIETLLGKTLTSVVNEDDERIVFTTNTGQRFALFHEQDCCESVRVEEIIGDLSDLVGSPITEAAEETSAVETDDGTWTFYKIGTRKGSVTLRWLGESNGFYSESVNFGAVK